MAHDHGSKHAHGHHTCDGHHHSPDNSKGLAQALSITLSFALVEAFGGWLSGSLALMSDAGHMLTDASALGLAALAARIATRPGNARYTWGLGRAEVVAAIANCMFMLLIIALIVSHAVDRMHSPEPVDAIPVIVIGFIGLLVNILVLFKLHGGHDLNTRAARLHVMGDLLGSVAAVVAGLVIAISGWLLVDPILSVLICIFILISSLRLLAESIHTVLEAVPPHLDVNEIGTSMSAVEHVHSVHDLHVWRISSHTIALTAHVVVSDMKHWQAILPTLQSLLADSYQIDHPTLQPECRIVTLQPLASLEMESPEHV